MKKSLIVTTLQRGNASRDAPRHKADAERQGLHADAEHSALYTNHLVVRRVNGTDVLL
ncbi:DUF1534 domain-containing protein [Pseudomonas syringae]|nr:DUF1534 domain-containing protein [Pseudomonas syringae]